MLAAQKCPQCNAMLLAYKSQKNTNKNIQKVSVNQAKEPEPYPLQNMRYKYIVHSLYSYIWWNAVSSSLSAIFILLSTSDYATAYFDIKEIINISGHL